MPSHLFVYGTLRSESRHPVAQLLRGQAKLVGKASAPGVLCDFGWYPGALFRPDAKTRVVGDVYALRHAERLLAQLDDYETGDPVSPFFRRIAIVVRLDGGRALESWTYELCEAPARLKPIESGDFILHRRLRAGRPLRA